MKTVAELEAKLSEASDRLIHDLHKVDGDLLILDAGGKMGPSLAKLAAQTIKAGGMNKKVTAVSRFQDQEVKNDLESAVVKTISCCIPGIHEVLRRQGLMRGIWCLNPQETLSVGQKEEIDRVYRHYPHQNDGDCVKQHLDEWLMLASLSQP